MAPDLGGDEREPLLPQLPQPPPRRTLGASRSNSQSNLAAAGVDGTLFNIDSANPSPVLTPQQVRKALPKVDNAGATFLFKQGKEYGSADDGLAAVVAHRAATLGGLEVAPSPAGSARCPAGPLALNPGTHAKKTGWVARFHTIKTVILTLVTVLAIIAIALSPESDYEFPSVAVSAADSAMVPVPSDPVPALLRVSVRAPSSHQQSSSSGSASDYSTRTQQKFTGLNEKSSSRDLARRVLSSGSRRARRLTEVNALALSRLLSFRNSSATNGATSLSGNSTRFVITVQRSVDEANWENIQAEAWEISIRSEEGGTDGSRRNAGSEESASGSSEAETLVKTWKIAQAYTSSHFRVVIQTDSLRPVALEVQIMSMPAIAEYEVLFSALILVFVYALIIFELVHRVTAAILGSLIALAVLNLCHSRPNLEVIVTWIDFETCALLFGMMVLVAIFSGTGFFEYAAVKAYKLSGGRIWRLITILCIFTAVLSAFLDNVTTILLVAPVTIRLCQVIDLDPKPILLAEVLFSNVGGTATAVGDPPNVIIVSNSAIADAGIGFTNFTLHLSVGVVFIAIASYFTLWFLYRNTNFVQDPLVAELEREIWIWRRACQGLSASVSEEKAVGTMLRQKIREVEEILKDRRRALRNGSLGSVTSYKADPGVDTAPRELPAPDACVLHGLESEYRITNMTLFIKSVVVLVITILLFFLHSFVPALHLDLGWIAICGAIALLVIADIEDLESVIAHVEWGTLLFFAALFVLMEGIARLGLLAYIGNALSELIASVDPEARLTVAILVILWTSAIVSAFIDNIPFTTAMIPVVVQLAESPSVNLPLQPLVWSLAFGTCLGGNGTLIGASANVVCAGIAGSYGYPITFNYFFRTSSLFTIVTVVVATAYLLIAHPLAGWNS